MPHAKFRTYFGSFKLLACVFIFLLPGCKNKLDIYVCLSDPAKNGFDCANDKTGDQVFIPFDNSDNYVAFSPDDFQTLLNFWKAKCPKALKDEN